MDNYTKEELEEALRAISSLISKCEKAQEKLSQGTSQRTLLKNRIDVTWGYRCYARNVDIGYSYGKLSNDNKIII